MRFLFPLALVCHYLAVSAQHHQWMPAGADAAGRGFTALTQASVFAANNNPALLAQVDHAEVGGYVTRSFLVAGLDRAVLAATLPVENGGFGLTASYFGYSAYNEQQVRLGYGRKLAETFSVGVTFTYLGTGLQEYGSTSGVTMEAGLLYKVSEKVLLGAHVFNPLSVRMGDLEEPVPALLQTGIRYASSDKVRLYAEISQQIGSPLQLRGGIEYAPDSWLLLQAGTTTQPVQFTAGMSIRRPPWQVHIAYAWHQLLGNTPLFHFSYQLSKNKRP